MTDIFYLILLTGLSMGLLCHMFSETIYRQVLNKRIDEIIEIVDKIKRENLRN